MITNLLDITKAEEFYHLSNSEEYIDIAAIISNAVTLYSPLISQRKIKINFLFNKNDKFIIKSHKHYVDIIINNIITNAIKYNIDNGKIFIELTKNEKWIILKVIDTGIGIEEMNLSKIFDKFFQIDNKITANSGGFGLGLYLVKKYLTMLKGNISVKSEYGKGSTFILDFNYE